MRTFSFLRPILRAAAGLLPVLWIISAVDLSGQTVPALVNYQGRLLNPDASTLATADYVLTFNLYDAVTNGARVWGPQIFDGVVAQGHGVRVPVVQGWFNVMLGPVDANGASLATAFGASNRFVEITVTNRAPIAPRQQVLTTPFAFRAATAASVDDGAITLAKLASRAAGTNVGVGGFAMSADSGTQEYQGNATYLVTNLTIIITTTGQRPVFVGLIGTTTNQTSSYIEIQPGAGPGNAPTGYIEFLRDSSVSISQHRIRSFANNAGSVYLGLPVSAFQTFDFPTQGIHTYSLRLEAAGAGSDIYVAGCKLIAFEL